MGATTQGGSLGFVMEAGRVVEVWAGSVSRGTTSNLRLTTSSAMSPARWQRRAGEW
jgi:hypothetical protein